MQWLICSARGTIHDLILNFTSFCGVQRSLLLQMPGCDLLLDTCTPPLPLLAC